MSEKNTGGPAFPVSTSCSYGEYGHQDGNTTWQFPGISIRDYFAVHASDEDVKTQIEAIRLQQVEAHGIGILPDDWHTKARYMHADAMLKARES